MRAWSALILLGTIATPTQGGIISTVAGRVGQSGSQGDGGSARLALLREPFGCEFDGRGRLLVADAADGRIRSISMKSGSITTVAGSAKPEAIGDGELATGATLLSPYSVVSSPEGDLYLVEQGAPRVRKVDGKTGLISTFAGIDKKGYDGDGGPANLAMLREPNDACLDGKGGLLIADVADGRVRRVDLATGLISTFAGVGRSVASRGDGGPATMASLAGPRSVCVDGSGNTYICEREGHAIRKVARDGIITTLAGTGKAGYSGDGGPATLATFRGPKGVRADGQGNLYVVDTENHAIRKIDAKTGVVATVAGGHKGADGDGGDATKAGLDRPHGCALAPDGMLYIADSNNHRVRRVSLP